MYTVKNIRLNYKHLELFSYCTTKQNVKPFKEIPGPKPLPIIGNTWWYLPIVGEYYNTSFGDLEMQWKRQFGDIILLKKMLGKSNIVLCFKEEDFITVLKNEDRYPRRGLYSNIDPIYHKISGKINLPKAIFFANGKEWGEARSVLNTVLYNSNLSNDLLPHWNTLTDCLIDNLNTKLRNENCTHYEISDYFTKSLGNWLIDLATIICFKQEYGLTRNIEPNPKLKKAFETLVEVIETLEHNSHRSHPTYYLDLIPNTLKLIFKLQTMFRFMTLTSIHLIPNEPWNYDFRNFDFFMKLKNEEFKKMRTVEGENHTQCLLEKLKNPITDKYALTTLCELYGGLTSSVSTTVHLCLYSLATNPEIQERLYEEIKKASLNENEISIKDLQSLAYLNNVIKETQRYFDLIFGAIYRVLDKDVILSGYHAPKGTFVQITYTSVLRNSKYFDDPYKFDPDRWQDSKMKSDTKYMFLPFGYGKRNCLGFKLSQDILAYILFKLISNYNFQWLHGDIVFDKEVINKVKNPYNFKITKRRTPMCS